MDIRKMLKFHMEKESFLTVAAIPVPIGEASAFGVISVDENWRMTGFAEKPADPIPMPGDPGRALVSMGNYIFNVDPLVRELRRDAEGKSAHDFGKDIIPAIYGKGEPVYVYDFSRNTVPGAQDHERGYWKDVGTIDAYWRCSKDLVSISPVFNLYNPLWPVITSYYQYPPAKFVWADEEKKRMGMATDSLISEGCVISGGHVDKSILSPNVRINSFSYVTESILFQNVNIGRHCRIKRTIIDKDVDVPAGTVIGFDPEEDRRRFHVSPEGVVVLSRREKIAE